jgi:hypothetical protein
MNATTLAQIYEYAGLSADMLVAQCQWSAANYHDVEARKTASKEWGRSVKHMRFVWEHFKSDLDRGLTEYEIKSLIAIASVPSSPDRLELYEAWRDNTLSYWEVHEKVDELKPSKPKAPTLKQKLEALICRLDAETTCGADLKQVCMRKAIADELRELLA